MQKGQDNAYPEKSKILLGKDRRKIGLFLISAALLVLLDQLSKLWIKDNPHPTELLPGFIDFLYSQNPGAVFGLPVNQTFLITITVVVLIAIILLLLRYLPLATTLTVISAGLIFGGAIGNLIERLRFGYVTDFIDVRLWGNFHWPAFNFADAAIVIGTCMLAYSVVRSELFRKTCDYNRRIRD